MFILGANLTNKSFVAGLEPMNDLFTGNPAALARWGSSFGSSLLPMSGARNELGRIMSPQLREVDQDIFQLFHNRNKWVDVVNPDAGLPIAYDWMDGKPVGYPEQWWTRYWNAVMPMKVSEGISPESNSLLMLSTIHNLLLLKQLVVFNIRHKSVLNCLKLWVNKDTSVGKSSGSCALLMVRNLERAIKEMRESGNQD